MKGIGQGALARTFDARGAELYDNHQPLDLPPLGLVGSGVGSIVVGAWDYEGAFVLAGSIGLASAVLALCLKAPGRPLTSRRIVPNPQLGEEMA